MTDQKNIIKLINDHQRRLQRLDEKKAHFGANTSPEILIEIEDIKTKIRELKVQLTNKNLQDENNRLRNEIEEVQDREKEISKENNILHEQVAELELANEKLKEQLSNLEKKRQFLEIQVKELLEKNNTILQEATLSRTKEQPDLRIITEEYPFGGIYISYAWGGESEDITNRIDSCFQQNGITLIRDKRDLGYNQEIESWIINSINRAKAFIVIVSDKYLKSKMCMFDFLNITKRSDFKERTFPIILADANIYNPSYRLKYINFWDSKIIEIESDLNSNTSQEALDSFNDELNLYKQIRNNLDQWMRYLSNINTLTPEMHIESNFAELFRKIEDKLNEKK